MPSKFDGSQWDTQIYTAKDALATRPPKQYLVDSVLVLPSLNIVYGLPGSHKTNAVIDLAVCVSLGKPWLHNNSDFPGFSTKQFPVLWVDSDSGCDALHERFGASLKAHCGNTSQAKSAPIQYMSFPSPPFSARSEGCQQEIVKRAKAAKIKLIVFDNLGTISGGADENSYEMINVMNGLRYISEKARAVVIVIHHDTKHPAQRKSSRGHSSIPAAVNLELVIEREDEAITFTPTKQRDCPFDGFMALYEFTHRPGTEQLDQAKFIGLEMITDPKCAKVQNAIIQYITKHSGCANRQQLVDICHAQRIGRPRVVSELQRMVKRNLLRIKPNQAHNQTVYMLPNHQVELPSPPKRRS